MNTQLDLEKRVPVCGIATLLAILAVSEAFASHPSPTELLSTDRILLREASRLAEEIQNEVWPGWDQAPFSILLVTEETEFLVGVQEMPDGFVDVGKDDKLGAVYSRPRVYQPVLLATFPAVAPPEPTIVIGRPELTDKSPTAWLSTLMHEHFHQLQMSDPDYYPQAAALDLEGGDDSGQWMLDYQFPYDDPLIGGRFSALGAMLRSLIVASETPSASAAGTFWQTYREFAGALEAPDARYLAFQLWQEGVCRYVEYRTAAIAADRFEPSAELRALPGYQPFAEVAAELRRGIVDTLSEIVLAEHRRVAFYPLGAAMALLLDDTTPGWKDRYLTEKFFLDRYIAPAE